MSNNRNIEALRGLAALAVFFSHSDASHLATTPWLAANKEALGVFGVYLFFGISGYLIWQSASRCLPRPNGLVVYVLHRITRIVPLYLANIIFVIFALRVIGSNWIPVVTSESVFRHLFFTQSLVPSVSRALNPVLWTLTHEFLFYLLIPVIFPISYKVSPVLIATALGVVSMISTLYDFGFIGPFFQVLYAFAAGIALAGLRSSRMPWVCAILICISGFLAVYGSGSQLIISIGALAVLAIALSPIAVEVGRHPVIRRLMAPLALAGTISYSLYIWHYLLIGIVEYRMQFLIDHVPGWGSSGAVRGVLFTGFVIFVSWISYSLIERPAMGGMRQSIQSRILGRYSVTGASNGAP